MSRRRSRKRAKEDADLAARNEVAAQQAATQSGGERGPIATADVETLHVERNNDARLIQRAVTERWKIRPAAREVVPDQVVQDFLKADKIRDRTACARVLTTMDRINLEAEKLASPAASTNVNVQVNTNVLNSLSELSDEQLERLIAEGRAAGAGQPNGKPGTHAGGDHAGNGNGAGPVATNGTGKHD